MVELEWRTARPGGVTLVAVRIDNRVEAPGVDAHRVRIASRLDGPTWPPRVEGVPARPWDGDAAEVVVPTGRVGSLGFASPAAPADPPVEVTNVEPAPDPVDAPNTTPADVLRVLGDPCPPRDAVAPRDARVPRTGRGGGPARTGPEDHP